MCSHYTPRAQSYDEALWCDTVRFGESKTATIMKVLIALIAATLLSLFPVSANWLSAPQARRADAAGIADLLARGTGVPGPNVLLDGSPTPSRPASASENGPDVLLLSLLTIGAAGAAAL